MKRILLLVNTLVHLKWKQIFYQVYYRIRKPRLCKLDASPIRKKLPAWHGLQFVEPATLDGKTFNFLGKTADLHNDWNSDKFSKLWLYNLHYHDDLNAIGALERKQLNNQLINKWIEANPPLTGNGWEPYCLSLRIVNWVKWFSQSDPHELNPRWVSSLCKQTDALMQQLEYHILGNHLFANAKALVFAGSYLSNDYWLKNGLKILDKEIPEQFLEDGAHFELSPMYHAILLWDLADLLTLTQVAALPELQLRKAEWQQRFIKGLEWLQSMVHPNGDISFFNDATIGIAPTLKDLINYASKLNIDVTTPKLGTILNGKLLKSSGYAVFDWPENHRLLVDVAKVGPDYQPGHAHADTLSFELSLFGQRLLVNSGISQYGEDAERHRQRSTSAHNTVAVDGENSSEVWAGFRVARRAKPFAIDLNQDNGEVRLTACHDGYRRLPGKVTHCRKWHTQSHQLSIEDQLDGRFNLAVAYWHFHPDIRVRQINDFHFVAEMSQGQSVDIHIEGGVAVLRDGVWHPGFGKSVPNTHLEIRFKKSRVLTLFKWKTA